MQLDSVEIAREQGYSAALKGEFRAAPSTYKALTPELAAWYEGFDVATTKNLNPKLTRKFRARD